MYFWNSLLTISNKGSLCYRELEKIHFGFPTMISCAMSKPGNYSFLTIFQATLSQNSPKAKHNCRDRLIFGIQRFAFYKEALLLLKAGILFSISIPLSLFFSLNMKDMEPSACPETTSYAHEMEQVILNKVYDLK